MPINAVSTNTAASTASNTPGVPVTVWVKYNLANIAASISRIMLSA